MFQDTQYIAPPETQRSQNGRVGSKQCCLIHRLFVEIKRVSSALIKVDFDSLTLTAGMVTGKKNSACMSLLGLVLLRNEQNDCSWRREH